MKKELLFVLLISILLLLPVISAPEIVLSKEDYSSRETLQAVITGNFLSLSPDNILIYKEDKLHSEPVIKDLTKQDNKYYFYALLPNIDSNFSIRIENTKYIESGNLKETPIIKNFTIKSSNESSLSINPGFILSNKDFSIKIKALNKGQDINAVVEESGESKIFSIIEETEKNIVFSISNINSRKTNLKINNYDIPVFILKKINNTESESKLEFIPASLSGILISKKDYTLKIFLSNIGNQTLTNIKLSNNFNANIKPEIIDILESGNNTPIEVTVKSPDKNIIGDIIAEVNNKTIRMPVSFEITTDQSKVNINDSGIVETLSCNSQGVLCSDTQSCNGETVSSLEGACCKGQCIEKTNTNNYQWIAGIALIIILIMIIAWFVIKMIRKRKLNSANEILKERSSRYSKRMNLPDEVRGKLDKI